MIDVEDYAAADAVMNLNIHVWINALEVSSALAIGKVATAATLQQNSASFMTFLAPGNEDADSAIIEPQYAAAAAPDFAGAATLMAAWKPAFRVHLHYLSRFLNSGLPPEVRWLNGYRVLEWHFLQGNVGLAKDAAYRRFLGEHAGLFEGVLGSKQTSQGLIEETRALVAHAILAKRADPGDDKATSDLVLRTFSIIEALVAQIMNTGVDGVSFAPLSGEPPAAQTSP